MSRISRPPRPANSHDTPPGDYPFAFFAASNECYDPETFPRRILRVVAP